MALPDLPTLKAQGPDLVAMTRWVLNEAGLVSASPKQWVFEVLERERDHLFG